MPSDLEVAALNALHCLHIAVSADIAADVQARVVAWTAELEAKVERLRADADLLNWLQSQPTIGLATVTSLGEWTPIWFASNRDTVRTRLEELRKGAPDAE